MFTANGQRTEHCFPPSLLVRSQDVCLHYCACSKVSQDTYSCQTIFNELTLWLHTYPSIAATASVVYYTPSILFSYACSRTCNTLPDKQFPKALLSPRAPTPCQDHQGKYQQRKRKKPICILCTKHVMSGGGSCWQRLGPQGSVEQNWPHIGTVTSLHTLAICGILCSANSDMHR